MPNSAFNLLNDIIAPPPEPPQVIIHPPPNEPGTVEVYIEPPPTPESYNYTEILYGPPEPPPTPLYGSPGPPEPPEPVNNNVDISGDSFLDLIANIQNNPQEHILPLVLLVSFMLFVIGVAVYLIRADLRGKRLKK
jgi:hypothetical protein